jgi:hypothetical protein
VKCELLRIRRWVKLYLAPKFMMTREHLLNNLDRAHGSAPPGHPSPGTTNLRRKAAHRPSPELTSTPSRNRPPPRSPTPTPPAPQPTDTPTPHRPGLRLPGDHRQDLRFRPPSLLTDRENNEVGDIGGQKVAPEFSGTINQVIMPSDLGGWAVLLGNMR